MKIQYKFVNETISIDVPDDWGEILIDLDRQEYNNDHKETRRHYSLEGKVYEGMDYAVEDSGLEALFAGPTDEERLRTAIQQLTTKPWRTMPSASSNVSATPKAPGRESPSS